MKKFVICILSLVMVLSMCACSLEAAPVSGTTVDISDTQTVSGTLASNQPTPTDLNYSLERYNLIRRAYWVNGQREKANALPCEIEKPLGYIVLFTDNGGVVGRFVVDGKVSSLNSYLTPDSEYYEQDYGVDGASWGDGNNWLADVDGSYGENGNYIEWTGIYLYSDIPFEVSDPVVTYKEVE